MPYVSFLEDILRCLCHSAECKSVSIVGRVELRLRRETVQSHLSAMLRESIPYKIRYSVQ